MNPYSPGYGASLRQARVERVRVIRRRVIAGALALFVAVWLFITMMLVTGHDPALAKQTTAGATTQTATTTSSTPSTTTATSSTPSATTPSTSSSSNSSGNPSGTSAVTSSQS